jgi:hypothetical protein
MRTCLAKHSVCILRKHLYFNYRPLLSLHWTRRDLNALRFTGVMPGIEVVEVCFAVFRKVSYNPTLGIASVIWRIPGNGIWTCRCCVRNRCQSEVGLSSPTPEFKGQSLPSPPSFPGMQKITPDSGALLPSSTPSTLRTRPSPVVFCTAVIPAECLRCMPEIDLGATIIYTTALRSEV